MLAVAVALGGCAKSPRGHPTGGRLNVLWLVADDMSLELGAYGDPVASTPNLDRLAAEGVRFTHAFTTAGTCAPSRVAMITGLHASSVGAQHMRSLDQGYQPVPPPEVKTLTEYLRADGYFASNLLKLDYQFSGVLTGAPRTNWDVESGGTFRDRPWGHPFFAYVTSMATHESHLFGDVPGPTDPAAVTVPPYYPDTPAVRRELAQHYDNVAEMDAQLGAILDQLEQDGLADDTVVFFMADNGRGFPRDKRWTYDGGIHVPLIVRWPGELEPGTVDDQLISFVDLAPTVLSILGQAVPAHMQGRVFLGPEREPPPDYVFATMDRQDEAVDYVRTVRDERFKYIRNHRPDLPYGQTIGFRDGLDTMQEIYRLEAEGTLGPPADWYFVSTKPDEELYDTVADPYELTNLAADPAHAEVLAAMRAAHDGWVVASGDMGEIEESVLAETFWPGGAQPETPPPTVTPASGTYPGPVEVSLASSVQGASLAYRLGSDPPEDWRLYSAPFTLGGDDSVHVRAVRYGWAESTEVVGTYVVSGE